MIKLENISFSYNKKKEFIQDLSLEFKSGEITTILGPNGSGKSTLLHMMSTYLKPKSGKIYLGDKDLGKLKQKEISKYISCVYQENEAPEQGEEASADVNDDGTVNNPEAVAVDKDKLVFWSLFSGGDGEFMDKMISEYNESSPTKQVQSIMLVWADYYTKLQTAVAAGKGPDIGVSHASSLPELVEQGVVEPLDDYLDEQGVDLSTMYSETSMESVTFDGSIYAVHLDTHAEIMYFNKDILEQAGVALNDKVSLILPVKTISMRSVTRSKQLSRREDLLFL